MTQTVVKSNDYLIKLQPFAPSSQLDSNLRRRGTPKNIHLNVIIYFRIAHQVSNQSFDVNTQHHLKHW